MATLLATDAPIEWKAAPDNRTCIVAVQRYPRSLDMIASDELENAPFKTLLTIGGRTQEYDAYARDSMVFSPAGDRYAYAVLIDGKTRYIVDGVPSPPVEAAAPGIFSPDGKSFAFGALHEGQGALCVNGRLTKVNGFVASQTIRFSGEKIAYCVAHDDGVHAADFTLYVDYEPMLELSGIAFEPVFSPDGDRLAVIGRAAGKKKQIRSGEPVKHQLYVDYEPVGEPFDQLAGNVLWSDDGTQVICGVKRDGKWHVMTNGRLSPPMDEYSSLQFVAGGPSWVCLGCQDDRMKLFRDGKLVAEDVLGVHVQGETVAYGQRRAGNAVAVIGDREGGPCDELGGLSIVPGTDKPAYYAKHGAQNFLVIDQESVGPYDSPTALPPVFSLDGKRYAAAFRSGDRMTMVIDGKESEPFDELMAPPVFSPSGKHWAYVVQSEGAVHIVVDGQRSPPYSGVVDGVQVQFSDDNHCRVLMVKDDDVVRAEATIR